MIDIDKLTIGEIAKVEELSGQSISVLGDDSTPKGKLMAALLFVNKRREVGPSYTWAQAMDTPFPEVAAYLGLNEDESDEVSDDVAVTLPPMPIGDNGIPVLTQIAEPVPNDEPAPRRLQ